MDIVKQYMAKENFWIIYCFRKPLVYNVQVVLQEKMPKLMKSWLGSRSLLLHLLNLARKSPSTLTNNFLFKALTLLLQEHYIHDWQSMVLWLQSKASFLQSSKRSGLQKHNLKISLLTIGKLKILQANTPTVYRNCFRLSKILFSVANCIFF